MKNKNLNTENQNLYSPSDKKKFVGKLKPSTTFSIPVLELAAKEKYINH